MMNAGRRLAVSGTFRGEPLSKCFPPSPCNDKPKMRYMERLTCVNRNEINYMGDNEKDSRRIGRHIVYK